MLLTAGGRPINGLVQYDENVTRFNFSGSELGDEWTDAADHWPDGFYPVELQDDAIHIPGKVRDTFNGGTLWMMNHVMATIPIGLVDNFEVQMRQDARLGLTCWNQTSPLVFGDIVNGEPHQLGINPTFDVSRPNGTEFYFQNAFVPDGVSEVFDPAYYDSLGGAQATQPDPLVAQQWWIVRCVNDKMQYWFNGRKMCAPVDVPAWAQGRDAIGFHVIHYNVLAGEVVPGVGLVSPYAWASRIPVLQWKPYDTPLS